MKQTTFQKRILEQVRIYLPQSHGIEFDTDLKYASLIQFNNGVFNYDSGEFRKRTKGDYITKYLNWDYNKIADEEKINEI